MMYLRKAATLAVAVLLVLSALYPTIYLHELGHAMTAFALGCKSNWHSVDMSPVLVWSFGGDIDYGCLARGPVWATAAVDGAGTAINLLLMTVAFAMATLFTRASATALFLWTFAAANFVEAFSYLVVNTAIPRSDMISVLAYLGTPNFAFSLVAAVAALLIGLPIFGRLVQTVSHYLPPARAQRLVTLAVVLIAGGMVGARLPLTDAAVPTTTQQAARP